METRTPSYSITVRPKIHDRSERFGEIAAGLVESPGNLEAVDLVEARLGSSGRRIAVAADDVPHAHDIVPAIRRVPGVHRMSLSDRTFLVHLGGKIETRSKWPLKSRSDLSMVYTPGVGRVCRAIAEDPQRVFQLTIKRNTVAVVTDGTAVLGLGDLGPEAALPVMEGKAMLFKEFAGVDAFPICLKTKAVDEIVQTVKLIAPVFGGINLEDISAPRCFEVEERLRAELDIPVFHDDQHGTAVVVLAALLNALKIVGKSLESIKVVVVGAGAAGTAVSKILLGQGVRDLIVCDREGALTRADPERLAPMQQWLALHTNPAQEQGALSEVIAGADVFIGVSAANVLTVAGLRKMARDPIVFALANPVPEIMPEEAAPFVRVMATGRSDYPNQINNVLCFPGLFRSVLDSRAREINEEMKVAAAQAIAQVVSPRELSEDCIIPSVFNRRVADAVAHAVARAAVRSGVVRREREH